MLARADICKLRKKIARLAGEEHTGIQTVWGQGYTLREPLAGPAAAPHLAEAGSPFLFDDAGGPAEHRPVQERQAELDLLLQQLLPSG